MFISVQVALMVVGLFIMSRGRFTIGGREVGNPVASLVGMILAAQLPAALLIGIVLGLIDGPSAPPVVIPTRAGQPPVVSNVVAARPANDNWWVDPLVTCGAVLAAAGLTALALRAANETEEVFASLRPADTDAAP
jgi:hypothetical protein